MEGGFDQGQKLVIIIDQFERWLHSNSIESTNKLVRSLRQCDGGRVQVLLLVRSDFWMAITQFLNELEVDCLQGSNFEAIDLLPTRHAEKTLKSFGQALGALPEGELSQDHEQFVQQSVEGLAKDGKVICVRLALYAEMMKNRPWTISSLKKTGGTEGVGLAFLEESFGANANPKVRLHQRAARAVLKQLIPESGSLSMQMKSHQELMDASGYSDARMFDELMTLLDVEMRLLSPTDPAGVLESDLDPSEVPARDSEQRYYRLAHDYLVNALRSWLTRKQQETLQGRAELLLAERSSMWSSHSDRRFLPSLSEHGRIRFLTSRGDWTPTQAAMLTAAARKHGMAFLIAAAAVVAMLFGVNQIRRNLDHRFSADFVASLPQINTSQVAKRMQDMRPYESSVTPLLVEQFKNAKAGSPEKLHSAMALVGHELRSTQYLFEQLPKLPAAKLEPICFLLKQQVSNVPPEYSQWVADQERAVSWRLNCACVLARFEADSEIWSRDSVCTFVAKNLTTLFPSDLLPIRELLEPVSARLSPELRRIYADRENSSEARSYAADSWVFYNKGKSEELCDFLLSCDSRQFPLVLQALQAYESELAKYALDELNVPSPNIADSERDFRIANAAVVLYHLGQTDRVWPLLRFSETPQVRSYIVHWIASHGSSPSELIDRLSTEEDPGILQALLLALGEFEEDEFASGQLNRVFDLAEQRVGTQQASLTAACQWLAMQFGREFALAPVGEDVTTTPVQSLEQWLTSIESSPPDELPGIDAHHDSVRPTASQMATQTEQDLTKLHFVEGPTGEALRFDGDEIVELDHVQLPSLENGVSVSCWMRLSSVVQYSAVWSSMDANQNFQGIDLWLEAGKLAAHVKKAYYEPGDRRNNLLKIIGTNVGDSNWHQVTVTYDGTDSADSLKLYLDGVPVATTVDENSLDGAIKLTQPLTLAGRVGFQFENLRFKGDLGELHIFAANLPVQSVASNYNRELIDLSRGDDRTPLQQRLLEAALAVHDEDASGQRPDVSDYVSRVDALLESPQDWYWAANQHQMLRIHAGTFDMGSGKGELHETEFVELQRSGRHRRSINRVFALSAREVSIGQYQRLLDVEDLTESTQQKLSGSNLSKPKLAMSMLNWFEAVQYCNWLSRAENIPEDQWCYVPDPEKGYAAGMQVKPEFWKLTGYRLPTQAEWEYACRANTNSHRHYGYSDDLLGEYAWFQFSSGNEPQACGVLKPNDWGFFDMQGNAMEWCFDLHSDYPYDRPLASDMPQGTGVITNENREIRGAAYYDLPQYMRSAYRYFNQPSGQLATGFRVCRTLADGVEPAAD